MNTPRFGATLDDLHDLNLEYDNSRPNDTPQAKYAEGDVEFGRSVIERAMERLERDACASRGGLLQGALKALAEFGSVYGVLDTEEAFLEAAKAAWRAKR